MKLYTGHWFGHYDSRGGSTLILNAPDDKSALVHYVEEIFLTTKEDGWYEDYLENLEEELMRTLIVKVADDFKPDPIGMDLLYGEEEYAWGLCKKLVEKDDHTLHHNGEHWFVEDVDTVLEIWIGEYTKMIAPKGYILAHLGFFGEDAYGMVCADFNIKNK